MKKVVRNGLGKAYKNSAMDLGFALPAFKPTSFEAASGIVWGDNNDEGGIKFTIPTKDGKASVIIPFGKIKAAEQAAKMTVVKVVDDNSVEVINEGITITSDGRNIVFAKAA